MLLRSKLLLTCVVVLTACPGPSTPDGGGSGGGATGTAGGSSAGGSNGGGSGGGSASDAGSKLDASPSALSFNACLASLPDVFPDVQRVTVRNSGTLAASVAVTFTGTGAAMFRVDAGLPRSLEPDAGLELAVSFAPTATGNAQAQLEVRDEGSQAPPATVTLVGATHALPATAVVEAAIESATSANVFTQLCRAGSTLSDCAMAFPDTVISESTTLRIKLRNRGCPALSVTQLDLHQVAGGGNELAFYLDQPAQLPSPTSPLVLSVADGSAERTLSLRFSPTAVASGDPQRFGELVIHTNDPVTPVLTLMLQGSAIVPAIDSVPFGCAFDQANDPCRPTGPKVANQAVFRISNAGTAALRIDSARFQSSGSSTSGSGGRFTVAMPIDNTTLMPAQSTTLTVAHVPAALYVVDQIVVSATVMGQPTGSAGRVTLTVTGGNAPCLETQPATALTFGGSSSPQVLPLIVRARAAPCGDVTVSSVQLPPNPFFSLASSLDAGTVIPAGTQRQIDVRFSPPITGGRQASTLTIVSNDPAFGPPTHKQVLLESNNPLNQLPTAVLKGCLASMANCSAMGATGSMTVSLASFGANPKVVTLFGGDSTDPDTSVAEWRFMVTAPSPNLSWSLTGNQVFSGASSQTLTLDPTGVGQYRAFLVVKDTTGQSSGTTAQLNINVFP